MACSVLYDEGLTFEPHVSCDPAAKLGETSYPGFHDNNYLQTHSLQECACLQYTNFSCNGLPPPDSYCEYYSSDHDLQHHCLMINGEDNVTPTTHSMVRGQAVSLGPEEIINCCFYSPPSHLTHTVSADWTPAHACVDCILTSSCSDFSSVATISTTTPLSHPAYLSPPLSPSDVCYQHSPYTSETSLQQQDSSVCVPGSVSKEFSLYYSPISSPDSSPPAGVAPREKTRSKNSEDGKLSCQHASTEIKQVEVKTPAYRSYIRNRQARKDRLCFTPEQIQRLEYSFECNKYLSLSERQKIALDVGVSSSQVKTWYQNRRTKWKRSHKQIVPSP